MSKRTAVGLACMASVLLVAFAVTRWIGPRFGLDIMAQAAIYGFAILVARIVYAVVVDRPEEPRVDPQESLRQNRELWKAALLAVPLSASGTVLLIAKWRAVWGGAVVLACLLSVMQIAAIGLLWWDHSRLRYQARLANRELTGVDSGHNHAT